MKTSDFCYDLPTELIAKFPHPIRTGSRLLFLDPLSREIRHQQFSEFESLVQPGDLLVFNNTKVIPARLFAKKETGGKVEILIERILQTDCLPDQYLTQVLAHVRASHVPKEGAILSLSSESEETETMVGNAVVKSIVASAEVLGRSATGLFHLTIRSILPFEELLEKIGHIPLPPYLEREDQPEDKERYQTVYAKIKGAVAAPTAGLHFDENLLERLKAKGAKLGFVTLHVGAGTFQPIKVDNIDDHQMHSEKIEIDETLSQLIASTRAAGGRIIAVGTTVLRCLESWAKNATLGPYCGETNLFIKPGFEFKVTDALLTNFHLPASSLLVLVSAFAGKEMIFKAYHAAIQEKYRFFSFGDAMFISRRMC